MEPHGTWRNLIECVRTLQNVEECSGTLRMEAHGKLWSVVEYDRTVEPSRIILLEKVYKELTHTSKDKEPPPTIRPLLGIPQLGASPLPPLSTPHLPYILPIPYPLIPSIPSPILLCG